MYKATANNHDLRKRVASHATKGDPTRGVLSNVRDIDSTPTLDEVTLVELKERRARLIAAKAGLFGAARQANDAKLSAINVRIKELNRENAERYDVRVLQTAIDRVVSEPALRQAIRDEAKAIRIAHEMHDG